MATATHLGVRPGDRVGSMMRFGACRMTLSSPGGDRDGTRGAHEKRTSHRSCKHQIPSLHGLTCLLMKMYSPMCIWRVR